MIRSVRVKMLSVLVVALLMLPLASVYAADLPEVQFTRITYGFCGVPTEGADPADLATGESQLFMTVVDCMEDTELGAVCGVGEGYDGPQRVMLYVYNTGPLRSVITDILLEDGTLLGIAQLWEMSDDPYVTDYVEGTNFSQLPVAGFTITQAFSAQPETPGPIENGVGPGEWVGIVYELLPDLTYEDFLYALEFMHPDLFTLRVLIHVQDLGQDGENSAWFLNCPYDPTAITLASFGARGGFGSATVVWETGTEIDNAGFNLYRSAGPDGPFIKVNDGLIPAQGDPVGGANYSFVDGGLTAGTYYYLLEDVDLNGVATRHGPASDKVLPLMRRPLGRPGVSW